MKYNITLELLKRVNVQLEATSEEEAKQAINLKLMHEGVEFMSEELADNMFDAISVTNVKEANEQSNPLLGSGN